MDNSNPFDLDIDENNNVKNAAANKKKNDDEKLSKKKQKKLFSKRYIVLLVISIVLLNLGIGQLIIALVGFFYPIYMSFLVIESYARNSDSEEEKEKTENDMKKWLDYWLIFGIFSIVAEPFFDFFLLSIVGPILYFIFKILFLLYCQVDNNSIKLYNFFLKPLLSNYFVNSIDKILNFDWDNFTTESFEQTHKQITRKMSFSS